MAAGRILVGSHDGVYVILFEGDVRLTLCTAVDGYIGKMFQDAEFKSVVVDLTRTESIDSTSLGLLAKLSIQAQKLFGYLPTLVCPQKDVLRIILSMGFEDVFNIQENALEHEEQLGELPVSSSSEEDVRQRVLEAHRILMDMNEANRQAFHDLVETLESAAPVPRQASL